MRRQAGAPPFFISTRKGWVLDRPLIRPGFAGPPSPQGEGFGAVLPFPSTKPPLPARPAGGRAVTGVRYRAAGQAEKKRGPSQGPPNQKRWVQGGRTSSSLVFFPPAFFQRKPGPRPGPGGHRGAAPRGFEKAPTTRRVRSTTPPPAGGAAPSRQRLRLPQNGGLTGCPPSPGRPGPPRPGTSSALWGGGAWRPRTPPEG